MLTVYDWVYGITTLTVVFLSIIAGLLAVTMFKSTAHRKYLAAWRYLIVALVLFAVVEFVGTIKIFGIWSTPWLTHVIPSFILVFLIVALTTQINITRGCNE
jgi:hypothetical protein